MKQLIKQMPLVGPAARLVHRKMVNRSQRFTTSRDYWVRRYEGGGNSGAGSYSHLAAFKAEVLNAFVSKNDIASVMEFGCGDGNQLTFAKYPQYTGIDISPLCVARCKELFAGDGAKRFYELSEFDGQTAELCLSLDVVYHLIEDEIFDEYMTRLFSSSTRFVIVYSSNATEVCGPAAPHVKHRKFTDWVDANVSDWSQHQHIPNRYPLTEEVFKRGDQEASFADFYIYKNQRVGDQLSAA